MIEKALKYIVGMKAPVIQEICGETYSDKELRRISYNPKADAIELSTLGSLIDYIKSGVDAMNGTMFIHVESPTCVSMYSMLDYERKREYIAVVKANVPEFMFNRWTDHESFCIGVQSKFLPNPDRALLLKFAGTVESGTIAEYGDDGVTQKATVKTGIAAKSDALVPNPVQLQAYRTFAEVEQPVSQYIFRMQDKCGVQCALYEADGGAWRIEATKNIKAYLEAALRDNPGYIVIS